MIGRSLEGTLRGLADEKLEKGVAKSFRLFSNTQKKRLSFVFRGQLEKKGKK